MTCAILGLMPSSDRVLPALLALAAAACSPDGVTAETRQNQRQAAPAPAGGTKVGDTIPAFTAEALDVTGDTPAGKPFDSRRTDAVTVYAVLGARCPTTQAYVDRLREIETAYAAKGVDFVYIYPNRTDPSEVKRSYHKSQRFGGPLIDDQGAKIAVNTLAARRTAEMLVVDKDRIIRYRGAIDDNKDASRATRRHLAIALDEILAGQAVTTPTTDVFA